MLPSVVRAADAHDLSNPMIVLFDMYHLYESRNVGRASVFRPFQRYFLLGCARWTIRMVSIGMLISVLSDNSISISICFICTICMIRVV